MKLDIIVQYALQSKLYVPKAISVKLRQVSAQFVQQAIIVCRVQLSQSPVLQEAIVLKDQVHVQTAPLAIIALLIPSSLRLAHSVYIV